MPNERVIFMSKRSFRPAEQVAYTALLVALQVVLGNLVQIPLVFKQFNLGFLPVAVAGAVLGPVPAMIVGGLGDFFGAHLFPAGAYFFGFTLTYVLVGLAYGLVLYRRKPCVWRVAAVSAGVAACNLFLNSYWLSLLYASRAYWGWVGIRWWIYLIEAPICAAVIYGTLQMLGRLKLPVFAPLKWAKEDKPKTQDEAKQG